MKNAYKRILDALAIRTQVELAEQLNIKQSSISDALHRAETIPASWLVSLLEKDGLNPTWIKTGCGAKYLQPSNTKPAMVANIGKKQEKPPVVTFVLGLPGAGKSSYIKENVYCSNVICFDEVRKSFGHVFSMAVEPDVLAFACRLLRLNLMKGEDTVIDESITTLSFIAELVLVARAYKAKVEIIYLATPVDVCRKRRVPNYMPEEEFDRKLTEWRTYGSEILRFCDDRSIITPLSEEQAK